MKLHIKRLIAVCGILLCFTLTSVLATDQQLIFEMGESGQTINFVQDKEAPATPGKNGVDQNIRLRWPQVVNTEPVERIELAESGIVIEFPLNNDEIASLKEKAPAPILSLSCLADQGSTIELIEMGDGHIVSFDHSSC